MALGCLIVAFILLVVSKVTFSLCCFEIATEFTSIYLTLILGSPALLSDCVEEEAEMRPEPLAELKSLPNDSEEPSPEVDDIDPDPDPEDMELCLSLLWL